MVGADSVWNPASVSAPRREPRDDLSSSTTRILGLRAAAQSRGDIAQNKAFMIPPRRAKKKKGRELNTRRGGRVWGRGSRPRIGFRREVRAAFRRVVLAPPIAGRVS